MFTRFLLATASLLFTHNAILAVQSPEQPPSRYSEPKFPKERLPMWKQVEEAIQKGLPKTAIEKLEAIGQQALEQKAYPEAALALARKLRLQSDIQGGDPAEAILALSKELPTAPDPIKPALHAILGHWYWSYFQSNRWQFQGRSELADENSPDLKTWSLQRIFREIDRQYSLSLANSESLKATPIQIFDPLLDPGTYPDSYRPTLYDFLAHQAIEFYASGEQAGVVRQDAFEIDAASVALGPTDEFLAWNPKTLDADSPKLKAIQLYQALLNFHATDQSPDARLHCDLERIRFVTNNANGEEKAARTLGLLDSFAQKNAKHPLSSVARARLAEIHVSENDLEAAYEAALQGKNAFPDSIGGKLCHNLIESITAKAINVSTERVWNTPAPSIRVRYKNISTIHFRIVDADWNQRLAGQDRYRPDQFNEADRQELFKKNPIKAWTSNLDPTTDYQEVTHDERAPVDLKPGYYFLLYSLNGQFTPENNQLGACELWVSKLGLILRPRNHFGIPELEDGFRGIEGLVVDNQSGEPIAGANVLCFARNNNSNQLPNTPTSRVQTDATGIFRIPKIQNAALILVEHQADRLASQSEAYVFDHQAPPANPLNVALFTDRAIYRPGQTIHFKGIATSSDRKTNRYEIVPSTKFTVQLQDPNGQIIETLDLVSNDFGSFSGSMTAPRNRGTGTMILSIKDRPFSTAINVEEYKRPKFQVTLDGIKDQVKLDDKVTLNGKAMSYTGTAIQDAKIRYRVVRAVRWPDWFLSCFAWRIAPYQGRSQEIAQGWTKTNADGSFQIEFVAKPDRSIPEVDSPIFRYDITADVTDSNGETRTGTQSVSVGFVTAQANLSANDWQTESEPVEIEVKTSNLDGQEIASAGQIKFLKILEPNEVPRADILGEAIAPRPRPMRRQPGQTRVKNPRPITPLQKPDPTDYRQWPTGDLVSQEAYQTDADGKTKLSVKLPAGLYRAVLESKDSYGKPIRSELNLRVLNPEQPKLGIKLPHVFASPSDSLQPGQTWTALWGTGYDKGRALVEIQHRGGMIKSYWTDPNSTQQTIELPIDEAMRGGATVRVTYVRENRLYSETRKISVPWKNKELTLKWERFRNKLEPGAKEKWSLKIQGPDAQGASAELLASMYDASLDAFAPHQWLNRLGDFYEESQGGVLSQFQNMSLWVNILHSNLPSNYQSVEESYRRFPSELQMQPPIMLFGSPRSMMRGEMGRGSGGVELGLAMMADAAPAPGGLPPGAMAKSLRAGGMGGAPGAPGAPEAEFTSNQADSGGDGGNAGSTKTLSMDSISPRINLNETAFFFPQLLANDDGSVSIEFTMPEALTKWRFMALAHDKQLRSASLFDSVVTAKDLMVQPNPPRFLRQGDLIEFTTKVTNRSNRVQQGTFALHLTDAIDESNVDAKFENGKAEQSFELAANESKSYRWRIRVPQDARPITFKTIAATEQLSDGEQAILPVLSNKVLVSEAIPLPIRGKSTKEFTLQKLIDSAGSDTIQNQSLTLQMTSQPAWYAVLALPYLMEYPYECSEQTFNRLYANSLARHIAASDPKVAKVFETWRTLQPEALESPLSKNQDIQSILLEETPWLKDANRESQARRNVGILFDTNRLKNETDSQLQKLAQMQRPSGLWPWFPGGPDNEYLSLYIVTGFGRLRNLGVAVDEGIALNALGALDAWMNKQYNEIKDKDPKKSHLGSTIALYLYGRSFFLNNAPIAPEYQTALKYWLAQGKDHWVEQTRQSQAHLAVALKRFGDAETPKAMIKSFKERSVTDEELGMFWRDTERSWWWYHAPIETQAMMIEAFDEVAGDTQSVEECKVWLLKQKQTQDWKTTKATADAVYALLRRGENWLASDALVAVELAGTKLEPKNVERGTGFYQQTFAGNEIRPEMGKVKVTKSDEGVSWGGLHWEYLEDINKVTAHEATPLKLEKKLFKRVLTASGPVLEAVVAPVAIGDELICRVVVRTDRDMEYVHLRDYRGSGTEPVNVLSSYKSQDGLFYYESTRDTATHFFIDYLRKGTYVFEYPVRVQLAGEYPMGYASIECMYAPEFNSHSESILLRAE
ncbi:MAG: MG2 domain-containing protein [Pirellula sp.]|nr:MG2 domain-containing protein [Pirellula sp.]